MDKHSEWQAVNTVVAVIQVLADVFSVSTFIIAFFLSWAAFDSNVRDHSWELGVLRAIGLSSNKVMVYDLSKTVVSGVSVSRPHNRF